MDNIYLLAAIGAIVPDLLRIIEGKYSPDFPVPIKKLNYWLALIGQILIGVFTVFLLKEQVTTNVAAAACGFGGSTILTKILSSFTPQIQQNQVEPVSQEERNILWYWK